MCTSAQKVRKGSPGAPEVQRPQPPAAARSRQRDAVARYTLLHAEAVLALYGAGLDPFVGFYHALDFGRESLSCDLVEPLRVEVDRHALMLFRSEKLRAEDFSTTESGCLLGKAGRARFYGEWEEVAARLRKRLAESVSDVASAIVQAGAVEAPCSPPIGDPAAAAADAGEETGDGF